MGTSRGTTNQSVARACALLFTLEQSAAPMTAADLAAAVEIDRTVAHRLLRTLDDAGMVEAHEGRYTLGGGSVALANAYLDRLDVRRTALPYIVNLSATACADQPWVVYLSIPVGATAITIDRIWSVVAPLDTFLGIGTAFPLVQSAAGRSMLAFWAPERRTALLGDLDAELATHLDWIQANGGIEFNRGEHQRGICGIAAAVVTPQGDSVASIIVSGPDLEEHLDVGSTLATQVHRTARSIGNSLTGSARHEDKRSSAS